MTEFQFKDADKVKAALARDIYLLPCEWIECEDAPKMEAALARGFSPLPSGMTEFLEWDIAELRSFFESGGNRA